MRTSSDTKVILVGDISVGKSSLLMQFEKQQFDEKVEPTIGANFITRLIETSHGPINLMVWDTAGQEKFRSLAPMYYRSAAVAVLVYDVTQKASLEAISGWAAEIADRAPPSIKTVVVGNKIDATDDRVVFTEQGEALARDIGAIGHYETSALTGDGIDNLFANVAEIEVENQDVIEKKVQKTQSDEKGGCC